MMSKNFFILIIIILIILNINVNGERKKTYTTTKKKLSNTKFQGVYNTNISNYTNSTDDDENTLSYIEVNVNTGEQYEYKVNNNDISNVKSNQLSNKFSNHNSLNETETDGNDNNSNNNKTNAGRRLLSSFVDTRVQIVASYWPYSIIGQIRYQDADDVWHTCTGTLVGPRDVLTAGHCLHSGGSSGDWYKNFRFYPGRTASAYTGKTYYGSYLYSNTGWTVNKDWKYDYGLLKLSTTSTYLGWMAFGYDTSLSTSWSFSGVGYPSDKSFGTMWKSTCTPYEVDTLYFTDVGCSLTGMDGTGMYSYRNGYNTIYGIYQKSGDNWIGTCSGSICSGYQLWTDYHSRITSARFELICDWIDNTSVCN